MSSAILTQLHPEKVIVWAGADPTNTPSHLGRNRIPRTETPELPALIPVRDAVERFRSACSQSRIDDVDALLTQLETGGGDFGVNNIPAIESYHFRPQSDYLYPDSTVKLYKFPEHFDALGAEAGLTTPMPVVNDGDSQNPPKPDLTAEQEARVQAIYADDITLFDSIAGAGQELVVPPAPPIPVADEAKTAKIAAYDAHSLAECASDILVDGLGLFHVDADTVHDLNTVRRILNGDIVGLPAGTVVDGKYQGYKTVTGDSVNLGIPELDLIELTMISRKAGLYSFQRPAIVAAVNAATTQDELNVITW